MSISDIYLLVVVHPICNYVVLFLPLLLFAETVVIVWILEPNI